jgi:hypothetical protein
MKYINLILLGKVRNTYRTLVRKESQGPLGISCVVAGLIFLKC